MKEILIPIDTAGRVVLPKTVRDDLAIRPGDMLKVSVQGNEVTLSPKKEIAGFVRKGRALIFSTGSDEILSRDSVEKILANEREQMTSETASKLSPRKSRK